MLSRFSIAGTLSMPMMQTLLRLRASRYSFVACDGNSPLSMTRRAISPFSGLHLAAPTTTFTSSTVSQYGARMPCAPASSAIVT